MTAEVSFWVDQTLSNPSPSITQHEPCRGERKEQRDDGLVKVKHGHQSTLANLHPPCPPPVCCCKESCQFIRNAHKWYLKTLRPLKGGRQGEKRKGSVCMGWGGDSVRAPAPSLDHRWLIVHPAPLIAAILKKTPGTPSRPAERMKFFLPLTRHLPCLFQC